MSDFLQEKPGVVAALFVVVIVVAVVLRPKPEDKTKAAGPSERSPYQENSPVPGSPPAPPQSSRVAELNQVRYKDPATALSLAEGIVAKPENKDELKYAQGLIPDLIELLYLNEQKVQNEAGARQYYDRLQTEYPDARAALAVRLAWGRAIIDKMRAAISANDTAQVESLFKEYAASGHYLPRRDNRGEWFDGERSGLEAYAKYQLGRWRKLSSEARFSNEGFALITEALTPVVDGNGRLRLQSEMQQEPPIYGNEMEALAKGYEERNMPAQAFNAWAAAEYLRKLNRWEQTAGKKRMDYKVSQQLGATLDTHAAQQAVLLATTLQKDPRSALCPMPPINLLQTILQQLQQPAQRQPLYDLRLQIGIENYLQDTAPLSHYDIATLPGNPMAYEAKLKFSEQLHAARNWAMRINNDFRHQAFDNLTRDTNANVWAKVPALIIAEIEHKLPPNTPHDRVEETRRDLLRRMVTENRLAPPVETGPEYQSRWLRITALDSIYKLENAREEAFRNLRMVIQESSDPALNLAIQKAVQAAFVQSRKADKFNVLLELAGFYASEYGEGMANDPFRNEFRQALETSADKFGTSDRMRRVFVQALLASAFANEEVGRKAQAEAIKQGFEVVASVTPKVESDPMRVPSGLPGYSTIAVDNSTDYHILVIYDGPESFAVLCNPLRKGSFTLQNGSYRVAVMTPMGNIIPYHAKRTLEDEHSFAEYRVETSGGHSAPTRFFGGNQTYGNYTLLRPSDIQAGMQVDPKSGTIRR
jgi:hypothetical protein